jgi:hypothetical protein
VHPLYSIIYNANTKNLALRRNKRKATTTHFSMSFTMALEIERLYFSNFSFCNGFKTKEFDSVFFSVSFHNERPSQEFFLLIHGK